MPTIRHPHPLSAPLRFCLKPPPTMPRILKFYSVGLVGIGVQLAILFLLTKWMGLHYLAATLLAVEGAIVHNFFWHQRWTWKHRLVSGDSRCRRMLRFHLTSGAASLLGNLMVMRLLVDNLGAALLPANLAAIGCCSLFNFWAADQWVFRGREGLHAKPQSRKGAQRKARRAKKRRNH